MSAVCIAMYGQHSPALEIKQCVSIWERPRAVPEAPLFFDPAFSATACPSTFTTGDPELPPFVPLAACTYHVLKSL